MNENLLLMIKIISVVVAILIIITIAMFIVQKRYKKRQNRLFCEIYKKSGDRSVFTKQLDDTFLAIKIGDKVKRFFLHKDAIRKEYQKKLFRYAVTHYISFDEDTCLPFIFVFVNGIREKKYIGADELENWYNTKIWEDVGGIGKSNLSTGMIIAIVVGVVIFIGLLVYFVKIKGGQP